jgi:hypothetical protein
VGEVVTTFLIVLLLISLGVNYVSIRWLAESRGEVNDYKERWQNANRLLQGADLDAIAEGKPVAPVQPASPPVPKGPGAAVNVLTGKTTGKVLAKGHTTLTQGRLNKMDQSTRCEIERKRLQNGQEPVDDLTGLSDYYVKKMIELRTSYGYD